MKEGQKSDILLDNCCTAPVAVAVLTVLSEIAATGPSWWSASWNSKVDRWSTADSAFQTCVKKCEKVPRSTQRTRKERQKRGETISGPNKPQATHTGSVPLQTE